MGWAVLGCGPQQGAPAAYWASWADALHMISQRTPDVAHDVLRRLSLEEPIGGCLGELYDASSVLDRKGPEFHEGRRPPKTEIREPGEWPVLGFFRP